MIKDKLQELFEMPMLDMSFRTYLESLNTFGKITPKSQLELSILLLEAIQQLEDGRKVDEEKRRPKVGI